MRQQEQGGGEHATFRNRWKVQLVDTRLVIRISISRRNRNVDPCPPTRRVNNESGDACYPWRPWPRTTAFPSDILQRKGVRARREHRGCLKQDRPFLAVFVFVFGDPSRFVPHFTPRPPPAPFWRIQRLWSNFLVSLGVASDLLNMFLLRSSRRPFVLPPLRAVWVVQRLGRGEHDDSVPGDVTRRSPSGDNSAWSTTWSTSLPRVQLNSPGGCQICPLEGLFSCRPLPKRGQIFEPPPSPSPFIERLVYAFFILWDLNTTLCRRGRRSKGVLPRERASWWTRGSWWWPRPAI